MEEYLNYFLRGLLLQSAKRVRVHFRQCCSRGTLHSTSQSYESTHTVTQVYRQKLFSFRILSPKQNGRRVLPPGLLIGGIRWLTDCSVCCYLNLLPLKFPNALIPLLNVEEAYNWALFLKWKEVFGMKKIKQFCFTG